MDSERIGDKSGTNSATGRSLRKSRTCSQLLESLDATPIKDTRLHFPDLLEWAARAGDRIVVRQWHGGNVTIGPRTLAGQTAQQIPITPSGIRADYAEIQAALYSFVPLFGMLPSSLK